jgi:hypothetical protein
VLDAALIPSLYEETPQAFPGPQIRLFVTETGAWSVLVDNKFFMVCGLGLLCINKY